MTQEIRTPAFRWTGRESLRFIRAALVVEIPHTTPQSGPGKGDRTAYGRGNRHGVVAGVRDIDLASVRGHRHALGTGADRGCRDHSIRRCVDHRYAEWVCLREIDLFAVRGYRNLAGGSTKI
jgi:hypothetical protein